MPRDYVNKNKYQCAWWYFCVMLCLKVPSPVSHDAEFVIRKMRALLQHTG